MNPFPLIEPDFEIPKGSLVPKLRQKLTFQGAVNLTGATFQLLYRKPGSTVTISKTAALAPGTTPLGGIAAATDCEVEYGWIASDVDTEGAHPFQWKITPLNEQPFHFPPTAPVEGDEDRVLQFFRVLPTL